MYDQYVQQSRLLLQYNELRWDLLNVEHASTMPAVIWKGVNIGKMKESDRKMARVKSERI